MVKDFLKIYLEIEQKIRESRQIGHNTIKSNNNGECPWKIIRTEASKKWYI